VPEQLYSVDQVADILGLHVRTVRTYVRDGKLPAVRIGKQYRITGADLAAFTGRPVPTPARETVRRSRHAEASSIVQIDAISPETMTRLTTLVTAIAGSRHRDHDEQPLGVQAVYDEERATLKIVLLGGLASTADLVMTINSFLEQER
jgi:excisionase family DNA binding protein